MAGNKYGKYFALGPLPEWASIGHAGPTVAYADDRLIKGCNCYSISMVMPTPPKEWGKSEWGDIKHGTHQHEYAEVILHIGTNPDDPTDLGAEVEFCMGPELEKHLITKSSVVYIPPNFVHGPWTVKRVERPFILGVIDQGPGHSEKPRSDLVPEKERDKMVFINEELGGEKVMKIAGKKVTGF